MRNKIHQSFQKCISIDSTNAQWHSDAEEEAIVKRIIEFILRQKFPLLIACIAFLFATPFLHKGFPIGQDNIAQLVRTAARIKATQDGQFPIRWAADLNYGYGHPGFIFFYSLPGYLGAFFYFFGIHLEASYNILMVLTFIATPLSFYLWTKKIFKPRVAFVVSLLYGLAPYSFLDTFVRIHLGESLALFFIPLILLCIERNSEKIAVQTVVTGGLLYCLLLHAHTILSLIFTFIFTGYIIVKGLKNPKSVIANFFMLGGGLLISSYFIIPALWEGKYINAGLFLGTWYKSQFLNFRNIIYSPWGFGSDVNVPGGLSAQIGPVHCILAILSVVLLIGKTKMKPVIVFWIIVFAAGVFMSLSISDFIWSRISILQQFQFPWRFTSVTFLAASVLAGYFLSRYHNTYILLGVMISILVLAVPMARFWKISPGRQDTFYFQYPGTAAYHNEATTIWVAGDASAYPRYKAQIIAGTATISGYQRRTTLHTFQTNAKGTATILDNTVYFPGWQVNVDGRKVPIEFQDMNYRGLITFSVPSGTHQIIVRFTESPIRLVSDMLSVAGIALWVAIVLFREKIQKMLQRI